MLNTSENLPEKCLSCANNTASAVHKKCKFCQDLRFSESLLCHLNRSVQSPDKFICYAFRQKLINVNKPTAEKACLEIVPTDSFRADKIKKLLDSDKAKYRNALAVQRLQGDPDGVYLDLKYHFVWNVLCRRAVFENSADYFDFTSDLFLTCGDMVGGYAQVLWLAPDHVHIYVVSDGRDSVDTIIRKLKQHSGKAIIDSFPEVAKKLNPKNRLWDKAYFSETIG
jgi:REP element-mobilizing transposase RayT